VTERVIPEETMTVHAPNGEAADALVAALAHLGAWSEAHVEKGWVVVIPLRSNKTALPQALRAVQRWVSDQALSGAKILLDGRSYLVAAH
jgi:hypothetical protein